MNDFNPATIVKMIELLDKKGDKNAQLDRSEVLFMMNHLSTFCDFIIEASTEELVKDGVERGKAEAMLGSLHHISKMAGSAEFHDFLTVEAMLEE